jgi:hypothetical protein
VAEDLARLGVTKLPARRLPWPRGTQSWAGWFTHLGCTCLLAVALMLMVLGVVFVVRLFVN